MRTLCPSVAALAATVTCVALPPLNDSCGSAITISGNYAHFDANNSAATVQSCEAFSLCNNEGTETNSIWYRIVPSVDGLLEVAADALFPGTVSVFNGCAVNSQFGCFQPLLLTCDNGWPGASGSSWSFVSDIQVAAGEDYLIKIAAVAGYGGPVAVDICLHPYLPHDQAAAAREITGIEFNEIVDIIAAHSDLCETSWQPSCVHGYISDTVWYRYTATVSGTAIVQTFGSDYNTVLSAFDGTLVEGQGGVCTQPNELTCSNYEDSDDALIFVPMAAGQTRWFRVDGDWGRWDAPWPAHPNNLSFNFAFLPTGAPPNDTCSTATVITTNSFHPPVLPITQANASSSEPAENCETLNGGVSNSVFYKFTAPANGTIDVNTLGSDYDTVLSVFTGCGIVTLGGYIQPTLIACDNDIGGWLGNASLISDLSIDQGDTYVIKVSGNGPANDAGVLDFNFEFTPALACPADLANGDGIVNGADLSVLLGSWGGRGAGDLNSDGIVNAADLSILLGAWGACP